MPQPEMIIADDDLEFTEMLRIFGESIGFNVRTAADGNTFKTILTQCDPDVIMLDIVMPDTDGNQLLMWLSERGETAPVIMMTGYDGRYSEVAEVIGTGGGLNMLNTLQKPFNLNDLESVLRPIAKAANR
jgi:DNA-binding response OmpR family regulator